MSELIKLAAKVETLTGPCRETSDEVLLSCGWSCCEWGDGPDRTTSWLSPDDCDYFDGDQPHPTSSLDAAMMLVPTEIVPMIRKGQWWHQVEVWPLESKAHVAYENGDAGIIEEQAIAVTAPLALTAAALRARAALNSGVTS